MDASSLLQSLLAFDDAPSAPERLQVLADHPVLLADWLPDVISQIEAAARARARADLDAESLFNRIGNDLRFLQRLAHKGQLPPLTLAAYVSAADPDALWPLLVRYHLSLGEPFFLHRAIEVATRARQDGIAAWLGTHLEEDSPQADESLPALLNQLSQAGHIDGWRALFLLWISRRRRTTLFTSAGGVLAVQGAEEIIEFRSSLTEHALTLSHQVDDALLTVRCALEIAKDCILSGDQARAEEWLGKGIRSAHLFGAFGEKHLDTYLLTAYSDLAMVYRSTGRLAEAAGVVERSVEVLERLERHVPEIRGSQALMSVQLGFARIDTDELDAAADAFRTASDLLRGEHTLGAADLGSAALQIQEGLAAISELQLRSEADEEARSLLAELSVGDQEIIKASFSALGEVDELDLEAAEVELSRVLRLCESIEPDSNRLVRSTTNLVRITLAEVVVNLGQPGLAEALCKKALGYFEAARCDETHYDPLLHAHTHTLLGRAYLERSRGWVTAAIKQHRSALAILEEAEEFGALTAETLFYLASALLIADELDEAWVAVDRALKLSNELHLHTKCLLLASEVLIQRGEFRSARRFCQRALRAVEGNDPSREAVCLARLGLIHFRQREYGDAVGTLQRAVVLFRSHQSDASTLAGLNRNQEPVAVCYDLLMHSLVRLGRFEESFAAAESGRASALNALFTTRISRSADLAEHQALTEMGGLFDIGREFYDSFIQRCADGRMFSEPGGERFSHFWPERDWKAIFAEASRLAADKLRENRDSVINGRLSSQRRLGEQGGSAQGEADPTGTSLPDGEEIASLARDSGATLVTIRSTEWGTCVLIAPPNGAITGFELPDLTLGQLRQLTDARNETGGYPGRGWFNLYRTYKETLGDSQVKGDVSWEEASRYRNGWIGEVDKVLRQLGEQIAKPLMSHIQPQTPSSSSLPRIVLVTSNPFALLPIHAFNWSEEGRQTCLLDHSVIQYAPSLTAYRRCLEREPLRSREGTLFAVGNPAPPGDLLFAELECAEIARLFPPTSREFVIGESATRNLVLEKMRSAGWLHLSCHGETWSARPFHSCLKLAGDEVITVAELVGGGELDQAWLVTLGACESGRVSEFDLAGDHFGLPAAFLLAGAPTVFASLWLVDESPATVLLITKVYQLLVRTDLDKASALRAAQLWLRDLNGTEAVRALRHLSAAEGLPQRLGGKLRELINKIQFADDTSDEGVRPFSHPVQWANFACFGA